MENNKKMGRPIGAINKRRLFLPGETALMMLPIGELEDHVALLQKIINRKRKRKTPNAVIESVYLQVLGLLNGKIVAGGELKGVELTEETIRKLSPLELQWLDFGGVDIENEVFKALGPLRDKSGKLKTT